MPNHFSIVKNQKETPPIGIGLSNQLKTKNKKQKTTNLLLILVDVTEQIRTEKKLLESFKHLGAINRQVSILLELNKKSNNKKNVSEIINYITSNAANLSQADICSLYRFDRRKKKLILLKSFRSKPRCKTLAIKNIQISRLKILQTALKQKNRLQSNNQNIIQIFFSNPSSIQYCLMLPIIIGTKTKGIILLGFSKRNCITTQELEFYEAFSGQVSFILQNFKIF